MPALFAITMKATDCADADMIPAPLRISKLGTAAQPQRTESIGRRVRIESFDIDAFMDGVNKLESELRNSVLQITENTRIHTDV